ncbi:MAG: hypothetical protein A2Z32_02245 [Chloroflexi bacterium RBG_16_69_14]|nr:MAG: hypothetical protein A2Z32_02245 [Chloroflexi bacterium RBG_16_69_14]
MYQYPRHDTEPAHPERDDERDHEADEGHLMADTTLVARPTLGRIALGAAVGAAIALGVDALLVAAFDAILRVDPHVPLQPGSTIDLVAVDPVQLAWAVVPSAIGAGVVYGVLSRLTARPGRAFVVVAAIVFLLFLGGPASLPIPASEKAALVVLHLATAISIVAAILALARPSR